MRDEQRKRYVAHRMCPACRRRNTEIGQRGDRLMHQTCRKWIESGLTIGQVCDLVRDDLVRAALTPGHVVTTAAMMRLTGMGWKGVDRSTRRLINAGEIERLQVVNGALGRTFLYRRVTTRRDVAA